MSYDVTQRDSEIVVEKRTSLFAWVLFMLLAWHFVYVAPDVITGQISGEQEQFIALFIIPFYLVLVLWLFYRAASRSKVTFLIDKQVADVCQKVLFVGAEYQISFKNIRIIDVTCSSYTSYDSETGEEGATYRRYKVYLVTHDRDRILLLSTQTRREAARLLRFISTETNLRTNKAYFNYN